MELSINLLADSSCQRLAEVIHITDTKGEEKAKKNEPVTFFGVVIYPCHLSTFEKYPISTKVIWKSRTWQSMFTKKEERVGKIIGQIPESSTLLVEDAKGKVHKFYIREFEWHLANGEIKIDLPVWLGRTEPEENVLLSFPAGTKVWLRDRKEPHIVKDGEPSCIFAMYGRLLVEEHGTKKNVWISPNEIVRYEYV